MVEVFGNLWKQHVDQLLCQSIDDILPANSPAIQHHLDMTALVGQVAKNVPDSFIQAASDEPHMMDSLIN